MAKDSTGEAGSAAMAAATGGWSAVAEGAIAAAKSLKELGDTLASFVAKSNPGMVVQYQMALDNLTAAFGKLAEPLLNLFLPILDAINRSVTSLQEPFNELFDSISSIFQPMIQLGESLLNHFLTPIIMLMKVFTVLAEVFKPVIYLVNFLRDIFSTLIDTIDGVAMAFLELLLDPIKEVLIAIKPYIDQFVQGLKYVATVLRELSNLFLELIGQKKPSDKNKTIAAQGGQVLDAESLGKDFRQAALTQAGGSTPLESMATDIGEIKKLLQEWKNKALAVRDAVKQGVNIGLNPWGAIVDTARQWMGN